MLGKLEKTLKIGEINLRMGLIKIQVVDAKKQLMGSSITTD